MALRIIGIDHGSKEQLVKDCGAEVFIDSMYSCFVLGHSAPVSGVARIVPKTTRGSWISLGDFYRS